MDKNKLLKLMDEYRATGRLAFHYPRKRRISLNGFRPISEQEATQKMKETIRGE